MHSCVRSSATGWGSEHGDLLNPGFLIRRFHFKDDVDPKMRLFDLIGRMTVGDGSSRRGSDALQVDE